MQAVQTFAANGGPVLGICNGFQILCEAGLLPGALIRNRSLQFRCEHVFIKTLTTDSPFTNQIPAGKLLRVPIAHGEGCYFADDETISKLKANNQILWQYTNAAGEVTDAANPNGSLQNIAGICNERRNVAGLMPHPERASEALLGSADGRLIFESLIHALQEQTTWPKRRNNQEQWQKNGTQRQPGAKLTRPISMLTSKEAAAPAINRSICGFKQLIWKK